MKVRLYALLGICIAILIVSGPDTQGKKPDNPGKPEETQSEWITFTEDLIGAQKVESFYVFPDIYPEYTMTLPFDVGDELAGTFIQAGTPISGHLFINYAHGTGRKEYMVHFWTDYFGIEIIGGVIDYDRKTEVTEVNFENELCFLCENMEVNTAGVPTGECLDHWTSFVVSFTLKREPCSTIPDCVDNN